MEIYEFKVGIPRSPSPEIFALGNSILWAEGNATCTRGKSPTKGRFHSQWRLRVGAYKKISSQGRSRRKTLHAHCVAPLFSIKSYSLLFLITFSLSLSYARSHATAIILLPLRGGKEDGSLSQFDGTKPDDVDKAFLVFENLGISDKSEEEMSAELLRYLKRDAFD